MNCYEFFRGDTFSFKTRIKTKDDTPIKIEDLLTIFVTVKECESDTAAVLFQKKKDEVTLDSDGYLHVVFLPKDTEELTANSTYYFDIEVTTKSGIRKTKKGSFKLKWDATTHEGE